jgi:CRP/FNR family transcriptional regulator, cyclic AMP receptor protein
MLLNRSAHRVEALKRVPLFADLDSSNLELIAKRAEEVDAPAGKTLIRQGEPGREFILILEGSARVEKDGRTFSQLSAGDFLGEMSLIDGKPRVATVIAESPSKLLVIKNDAFQSLLDEVPGFRNKILVVLSDRLRGLQSWRAPDEVQKAGHVDLDHFYTYGELYETLDVCGQMEAMLGRLKREELISGEEWSESTGHLSAIRERLETHLDGAPAMS